MKFSTLFFLLAFVFALPGLLLLANLTWFAFFGSGFLPVGTSSDMNAARAFVIWASCTGAMVLAVIGATK